jgi:hypothetical protein
MAGNPLTDPNWASDLTDTIVDTIDKVRDRTTKPVIMAARGLVFGILTAFLAMMALAMLLIAISRGLINLLEWPLAHETSVWVSHLTLGALFCSIGTICMIRRHGKEGV